MDTAINCWEFMHCGREPGGHKVADLGVCPAANAQGFHGVNEGTNGGRFCWAVVGTLCHGQVQGTFAEKAMDCMACPFYAHLAQQYRNVFIINPEQLS